MKDVCVVWGTRKWCWSRKKHERDKHFRNHKFRLDDRYGGEPYGRGETKTSLYGKHVTEGELYCCREATKMRKPVQHVTEENHITIGETPKKVGT